MVLKKLHSLIGVLFWLGVIVCFGGVWVFFFIQSLLEHMGIL